MIIMRRFCGTFVLEIGIFVVFCHSGPYKPIYKPIYKPYNKKIAVSPLFLSTYSLTPQIGVRGFEPPTPWSRTKCATRLRYTPKFSRDLTDRDGKCLPKR